MDKKLIESVLEDYLQALYKCGTLEEQNNVREALKELENKMDISNLDKWLMDNPEYSQEERELIVEAIEEYGKNKSDILSPKNINNAQHPSRQKAIHILEAIRDKMKICAICKATFKPNKNAKTTETRHLCSKCRKIIKGT